jgi:uncharacterized protein
MQKMRRNCFSPVYTVMALPHAAFAHPVRKVRKNHSDVIKSTPLHGVYCRERVLRITTGREEREMSTLLCPSCMVELTITDRQGVAIDYCPQCRGVWLERGELDKILARSQQGSARRYEDDDDDDDERYRQGDPRRRRRKSFWEELFD